MLVSHLRSNCVLLFYFSLFIFELWVEGAKLVGNLTITEAVASFLHLSFVFDLKYPEVCSKFMFGVPQN